MQASRHLNLAIPPVVEGKEHRSYLQIRMESSFLGAGHTAFQVDTALLKQASAFATNDALKAEKQDSGSFERSL